MIVRRQETAADGEIVVALVGEEPEATVKRFFRENDHVRLQPENSALEPILTTDVQVLGRVVGRLQEGVMSGALLEAPTACSRAPRRARPADAARRSRSCWRHAGARRAPRARPSAPSATPRCASRASRPAAAGAARRCPEDGRLGRADGSPRRARPRGRADQPHGSCIAACPTCGRRPRPARRRGPAGAALELMAAGQAAAGGSERQPAPRGKSGHRRAGWSGSRPGETRGKVPQKQTA